MKAHLCFASLGGEHVFSKRYLAASQDSKQNFMASSFQHSSLYLTSGGSLKMEIMIKLYDEIYSNKIFDLAALKEEVHELSRQMKLLVSSVSSMRLSSGPWLECPVCYEEVKPPMRLKHCAQVNYSKQCQYLHMIPFISRVISSVTVATPRLGPMGPLGL